MHVRAEKKCAASQFFPKFLQVSPCLCEETMHSRSRNQVILNGAAEGTFVKPVAFGNAFSRDAELGGKIQRCPCAGAPADYAVYVQLILVKLSERLSVGPSVVFLVVVFLAPPPATRSSSRSSSS